MLSRFERERSVDTAAEPVPKICEGRTCSLHPYTSLGISPFEANEFLTIAEDDYSLDYMEPHLSGQDSYIRLGGPGQPDPVYTFHPLETLSGKAHTRPAHSRSYACLSGASPCRERRDRRHETAEQQWELGVQSLWHAAAPARDRARDKDASSSAQ
eukprot:scaffold3581_cov252-Pinguiococcus_pyrenoidosus.AAC.30